MSEAANTTATIPTYNLYGTVSDVSVRTDAKGRPYAVFNLTKTKGGKPVRCVAFDKHMEKVKTAVENAKGGVIHLFGRFDHRTFTKDGETRTSNRFFTLWADMPRQRDTQNQAA